MSLILFVVFIYSQLGFQFCRLCIYNDCFHEVFTLSAAFADELEWVLRMDVSR